MNPPPTPYFWLAAGDSLVDYLVMMKRCEIEAHAKAAGAGAWEMAEYFEIF